MKKVQKSDIKTAKLKIEKDMFGLMLALSVKNHVAIDTCMSFPLAPVPPSLFHYNGDML